MMKRCHFLFKLFFLSTLLILPLASAVHASTTEEGTLIVSADGSVEHLDQEMNTAYIPRLYFSNFEDRTRRFQVETFYHDFQRHAPLAIYPVPEMDASGHYPFVPKTACALSVGVVEGSHSTTSYEGTLKITIQSISPDGDAVNPGWFIYAQIEFRYEKEFPEEPTLLEIGGFGPCPIEFPALRDGITGRLPGPVTDFIPDGGPIFIPSGDCPEGGCDGHDTPDTGRDEPTLGEPPLWVDTTDVGVAPSGTIPAGPVGASSPVGSGAAPDFFQGSGCQLGAASDSAQIFSNIWSLGIGVALLLRSRKK